ncbi:MAG: sensor domain-containing diguanylate cyclase [Acidobacteria bacterium]|nr:MAG: sensor domain-containing diguanylate cyclase [Acidobacteriota bacterium]
MDPKEEIAELKRQVERLSLFHEVGKALASTLDLQKILQTIMEKISDLLQPDNWSLLMLDEATQELYFEIAIGSGADKLKDVRLKLGEGIAGWVAQQGEPVLIEDVRNDPRFTPKIDELTQTDTQSVVCVPVKGREKILGVIELVNFVGKGSFRKDDIPILKNLADYAAIALENARYVQRIHELTITDDCTSLYNARHLNFVLDAEIYRSTRYGYEFSVIFIDLDYFKQVNDTYGHLVGSRLLGMIGDVIKSHLRMIDYAFRYGGDEFVVLLPQTSKWNTLAVVKRIKDLMNSKVYFAEEGLNIRITASFGIASFPIDGRTRKEILRRADEAMYLVKNTTRNNIALAGEGIRA